MTDLPDGILTLWSNWARQPENFEKLVESWIIYHSKEKKIVGRKRDLAWTHEAFMDICVQDKDLAWQTLLKIIELTERQNSCYPVLAAGPIETILVHHGETLITQIESEARKNPKLCHLLGGVWKSSIPSVVWDRILLLTDGKRW